jgi:hypothetical protein
VNSAQVSLSGVLLKALLFHMSESLSCVPSVSSAGTLANGDQLKHFVVVVLSDKKQTIKTFNNGSLGSGIDEERSEMR